MTWHRQRCFIYFFLFVDAGRVSYSLAAASSQGYTQTLMAILDGLQNRLDTLFLVFAQNESLGLGSRGWLGWLWQVGQVWHLLIKKSSFRVGYPPM